MFDNYTLRARYYPVVILFFPIIIMGFFYSLQFESYIHFLTSIGVVGALTYLFSQIGRDAGKRNEPLLWQSWGGAPSVQLLRWANSSIDVNTKKRYHEKLCNLCPVPNLPTIELESLSPQITDDVYMAWTKFLIAQTRDKRKFSLLFKENTSYGFRRNLWGLRPFAIVLTLILTAANYGYWALKLQRTNPMHFPQAFLYASGMLLIVLLFWIFIVNRNWVKLVAFTYAERLYESLDSL